MDSFKDINVENTYFKTILSSDIIDFEKLSDFLLLKLKAEHSSKWQDKDFLQYVASNFNCKRIAKKDNIINDKYRTPQITILLGNNNWVNVIENKISYGFDIDKCMFSRGNITEKLRISKMDCSDEIIVDLYAGIGYFTLPYLVHSKAKHVYACEWNANAIEALKMNLVKNKVADRCTVLEGDNNLTCPKDIADRVNLGLIPSCEQSWLTACAALKIQNGGTLHIHGTIHSNYSLNKLDVEISHLKDPDKSKDFLNLSQKFPDEMCSNAAVKYEKVCRSLNEFELASDTKSNYLIDETTNSTANMSCDKRFLIDEHKMNILISSMDEQIQNFSSVRKLERAWIEWSYYVCYQLKYIFLELYGKDWTVSLLHIERVKSYAPRITHLVLDIQCKPCEY